MWTDKTIVAQVDRLDVAWGRYGVDPYGVSKRHVAQAGSVLAFLYKHYFHVDVFGAEHVPRTGRAMLVGNHSGGIAIDGAMVFVSMLLRDPPRLVQGMADKFLARLPGMSLWTSRTGQFTGLPEHAIRLLEDERLLLVFPEGARGTAKLFRERYSLVDFGTGFMRLALRTKTPIVPFAFLGGGDAFPTVVNAKNLGRLVGAPYVPITPYLLPLPLPVNFQIDYADPMTFEGDGTEDDEVIAGYVERVKGEIARRIEIGRKRRRRELPTEERA